MTPEAKTRRRANRRKKHRGKSKTEQQLKYINDNNVYDLTPCNAVRVINGKDIIEKNSGIYDSCYELKGKLPGSYGSNLR